MHTDGVLGLGLRAGAFLDHLVVQAARGREHLRVALQAGEKGGGLGRGLFGGLGLGGLLATAEHALDLGTEGLGVELFLLAREGGLEALERGGLFALGQIELGDADALADEIAESLENLLVRVGRGGGLGSRGRGGGVLGEGVD